MTRAPDERFQYESLRLTIVVSGFGHTLAYINDRGLIVEYLEESRPGIRYRSVMQMDADAAEVAECEARKATRRLMELVR